MSPSPVAIITHHDYPLSYYADTANPHAVRPALEGQKQVDVCVIGGGYTGLSAALHCAERGFSTALVESKRIGWGASGRNGGQAIPGWRHGARDMVDQFGVERARALFGLAIEARDHLWERIARHDIQCDARRGHFLAAAKKADLDWLADEQDCLESVMGYRYTSLLDRAGAAATVASEHYHGGLLDKSGGHLHPLNLAIGLADAAEAAGAAVHETTRIQKFEQTRAGIVCESNRGRIIAKYVVVACDSYVEELDAGLARRIMPVANYNIATEPLEEELARSLIPGDVAVSDTRFVVNYFRLSPDRRLLFGGGEKYTPTPPDDTVGFVRRHMLKIFPQLAETEVDYAWGGPVSITTSRYPHVGRQGNIFFAHGYSGQGVILASFMGKLIAEALTGTAERFDLVGSLPTRAFPGGRLLRSPLYVAAMLWYALRDRL